MKIRKSFVTNSSSSSFVCEVCGSIESGMDASAEECGMNVCVEGHTFCEHHKIEAPIEVMKAEIIRIINSYHNWHWYSGEKERFLKLVKSADNIYDLHSEEFDTWLANYKGGATLKCECPICLFESIAINDRNKYIEKVYKVPNNEQIDREIYDNFSSLREFKKFLKEK